MKLHFTGSFLAKLKAVFNIVIRGTLDVYPEDEEKLYRDMKQQHLHNNYPPRPGQLPELHLLQFTNKGNAIFVPFTYITKDGIYYE